jgi:hypothetical protein
MVQGMLVFAQNMQLVLQRPGYSVHTTGAQSVKTTTILCKVLSTTPGTQ